MTREQFFSARQRMDFVKKHGVTACPPGDARTLAPTQQLTRRLRRQRQELVAAGQKMSAHPRDESGDAQPINCRSLREA